MGHLQADLNPVQLRGLEELGAAQRPKEVLLLEVLGRPVVQLVEHEVLQQLLVAHAHLDRVCLHIWHRKGLQGITMRAADHTTKQGQEEYLRAVLVEPVVDEGDVQGTAHPAAALVEGAGSPEQRNACRCVVAAQRGALQQGCHLQHKQCSTTKAWYS